MNGFPTSDFDLVVACVGSTSRTRAIGLGCDVRDHIRPTNSWAAYCTIPKDLLDGTLIGQAHSAVGGRTVALGADPSGGNRAIFMAVQPRNDGTDMRPFRKAIKRGDDATKQFVARHFKGMGSKCPELSRACWHQTTSLPARSFKSTSVGCTRDASC